MVTAVERSVNCHIYGKHNVVDTGEHVNQQVISIHKGDVGAWLGHLRESSVGESAIQDLRDARIHASAFQRMEKPGSGYRLRNLPRRYTVES